MLIFKIRYKTGKFFSSILIRLSKTLVVTSIRQGLTLMIPVMMIGAFTLFINHLPIKPYQEFMINIFGYKWEYFGNYIHRGTFAIMAAGMLMTISYSMCRNSARGQLYKVNPVITSLVSMASFFSLLNVHGGYLAFIWLGPLGVFLAIIIACLSSNC